LLKVRDNILKLQARITETANAVRIASAVCCPDADLFNGLVRCFQPAGR
jgi:hypothetical protein